MKSPSKAGTPVVGFNHNLNYKGRVFHVQTEDSGAHHGHIITHIFLGGNILRSTKSSYLERVAETDSTELFGLVRKLMEEQHKTMMKGLLSGEHDAEIARRTNDRVYAPGVLADGERAPGLLVGGENAGPKPSATTALPPAAVKSGPGIAPTPRPAPATIAPPPTMAPVTLARPPATRPPPQPLSAQSGLLLAPATPAPARRSPPPSITPRMPGPNAPLDEVVLAYLLSDPEIQRR
jgi:hypothetical protein